MSNFLKSKLLKTILLLIIVLIIPFSFSITSDGLDAKIINDSTIGYYQSTTCKISFLEVLTKNLINIQKLDFNFNSYPGIECFGRITGLDKIEDKFVVSIGVNSLITFLLQSFFWISLIYIFSEKRKTKSIKNNIFSPLVLSLIFTSQHIFEDGFYSRINRYYNSEILYNNYYLLTYFLSILFLGYLLQDLESLKNIKILFILPLMFIFNGTYLSHNTNFYLIFFSYFGIRNILKNLELKKFNVVYLIFSLFWITNPNLNITYFDGDKIRGLINSSYNTSSKIFWIVIVLFTINGLFYLIKEDIKNFNINNFKTIFLASGSIVVILGALSTLNNLFNFIFVYLFGLNKPPMKTLISVTGGSWRGFLPSAELAGEFYAVCLLITLYIYLKNNIKFNKFEFVCILICLFGLYKSNNVAASMSLILFSLVLIFNLNKIENFKPSYIYLPIFILFLTFILLNFKTYSDNSRLLINEAVLHSDLFQYENNYTNLVMKKKYFQENDYLTLMMLDDNYQRSSSSLLYLIKLYTPPFDIYLLPNVVGFLSFVSLIINRTELWGVFIAKYNPDFIESIFGYGPYQLNEYLYNHKIKLDFPYPKSTSLFLPHSSFLDLLLFGGVLSILLITFTILKNYKKIDFKNNIFSLLFAFFILNFLKSDGVLYIQGLVFVLSTYYLTFKIEYLNE